jgi:hypothetical protein
MTTVISLGDGSEIVVSSDLGKIRLSLWANGGSLGKELDHAQAMETAGALIAAVRKAKLLRRSG